MLVATRAKADPRPIHGRALIVEDSPTDRALLKALLGKMGVACDTARNAADGIAAALSSKYDFIFMDIMLPGMDGRAATRFIHESLGPASPFMVAVTALRGEADRRSCLEAGMDYFLAKPITLRGLQGIVTE